MSTQAPISQQNATALSYLRDVNALRGELETAMLAISGNRLPVLEESLWRQQVLCTSLKHLSHSLAGQDLDSPLRIRIREASLALQQLNRSYFFLVQQSSASTDLLFRLCRGYQDAAPSPSLIPASSQTWSCEA